MNEKNEKLMLKTFPFINEMKISEYNYLKSGIYFSRIAKGEYIMGTHDRCESIPMVISGALRLYRTSEEGREMTGYYVERGNICILAAICILGSIEYDFTTQAEEDTLVAMIPPENFRHLMDISIEFKNYIFAEMAEKLVSALTLMEELKFTSIEGRIISYLRLNSDSEGMVKITQENLAVNIGSVREVVSRTLKKLADDGSIVHSRGKIKLLKR
ncbi:MAG: Crp/Fnr family transcriptional regulator [Clostridia bacterium]|nr:Crp/Fnr family transcriptional regulator [Clostridia bacterium]MBN2884105.1 Crp/Fnr family transcriptional regulator [Clostridia bacterium]